MNIVLFGPPGAGKGTQANNIANEYNLLKISTGDLLRKEIEEKSSLGIQIKSIIDKGSLVSDNIIDSLIEKVISNKVYENRIIFDGYPRNLNQAKCLDSLIKKYNQKISCVLSLKVDLNIIVKRILGRQICSKCSLIFNEFFYPATKINHKCDSKFLQKRSDDTENTIKNRLKAHSDETKPILKYYENQKLLTNINGMNKIDEIYKEIRPIIHSLKTWLCKMYLYK